ncbi:hypothetical protein D9T14_01155 [Propionibacterium australiense]|uniref:Uncharacterized protein n=1 Tax=Propionibacterium australiense TaxID=119981 RepID=A0A8B3FNC1_9ACTN|nr:hypothetical protein D7U36_05120 [Propionibacterium australiense]RLP12673.1 hypothetical protein D9T14_01155 [Propionibacterium australiense]
MLADLLRVLVAGLLGAIAVFGGSPLVEELLRRADGSRAGPDATHGSSPRSCADGGVLRGGRWIGALERAAVFGALLAGEPSLVAVTVAVKAFARFPEIRGARSGEVAEHFIIGTLASLLIAGGLAALAGWVVQLW